MASKQSKNRRAALSFKDIQILYLMQGVPAIEEALRSQRASRETIRKALEGLRKSGRNITDFDNWSRMHCGNTGRGRAPPAPGETRTYKAQQVKSGGPFLRLPLDVLGVKKGSVVRVVFDGDCIVVSR